jgi:hypothetical protein
MRSGPVVTVAVAGALAAGGCGRIDYVPDAPSAQGCPPETVVVDDGTATAFCIDRLERDETSWTAAHVQCATSGGFVCAHLQWERACEVVGPELVDLHDDWEWVAEGDGTIGEKRGYESCTSTSTHVVSDPYPYRCCRIPG